MASMYPAVSWVMTPPSLWMRYRKSPVRAASTSGFFACPRAAPARMAKTITTAATERFCKNFISLFLCPNRPEVRRVRPAHQIVDGYVVVVCNGN